MGPHRRDAGDADARPRRRWRRHHATVPLAGVALLVTATPAAADTPAGGASLEEVAISSVVAALLLAAAVAVAFAHRRGRLPALDQLAGFSGRVGGQPGWAALPLAIAGVSLIVAVFGFYWDVATHIDHGRDESAIGNPAHWPILIGLLGIALAGFVSMLLGTDDDAPGIDLRRFGWWKRVPVGGALLFLCGVIALLGFPIDDVWHRIFGQDVTLWSPPHIQMVAGASLCTIAMWILFVEAERSRPPGPEVADGRSHTAGRPARRHLVMETMLAGAVLIGLSTLQGEFDYGVPQFRLLFQPLLIAVAAGIALVAARIRLGRGGALLAVAFFLALRGALSFVVSGVFEHITFHLPLYLGAAVAVELVALRVPPTRQLSFGAAAGLGIGTFGLAVETAWSHVWMPIPWTATMLPEAALLAVPTAVAAGLVGGFFGRALTRPGVPRQEVPTVLVPVATLVLVVALAYPLATTSVEARVEMELVTVAGPTDGDHVQATFTIDPPDLVDDAEWFQVIAWQGASWWSEDATRMQDLEPLGDGVYRTTEPVPVHGEWKALLRVHNGRVMAATPIFLPEDRGIPAEEVPAEPQATREFVPDHELLLREARPTAAWVPWLASGLMALIAIAWVTAFAFGSRHLRRTRPRELETTS